MAIAYSIEDAGHNDSSSGSVGCHFDHTSNVYDADGAHDSFDVLCVWCFWWSAGRAGADGGSSARVSLALQGLLQPQLVRLHYDHQDWSALSLSTTITLRLLTTTTTN